MRIAVSGTHFMGKSTLIEDFVKKHPEYQSEAEPYYKLHTAGLSLEPPVEDLLEELHYSIAEINKYKDIQNIIFDRCPVDFIAYAMCALEQDDIDIHDSEVAELFPEIKEVLNNLDLIIFLPISKENQIEYDEDNPAYRKAADKNFKKIYRDEILDIFPKYGHPRIIEIWGDREVRIKKVESYLM
jgi:hypothetical protein